MELLVGIIVGFAIGAFWGIWHATSSMFDRMAANPQEFKTLIEKIQQLQSNTEQTGDPKRSPIRIEWHSEVCYLYDSNDRFLAQGSSVTEALALANKRFPKRDFRLNESKESAQ
jgi:hypothetical protein